MNTWLTYTRNSTKLMNILNTTIQNRSKQERLRNSHTLPHHYFDGNEVAKFLTDLGKLDMGKEQILYSIGSKLLSDSARSNPNVLKFLSEYNFELVEIKDIPCNEFDLLGSAYQYLNSKLENLEKGSFYTGRDVAQDFVKDLKFDGGQVIFDPACGSGSFLFRSDANANQIYGVDADPIAIMIAKFNYFIKFPSEDYPKIFCVDFFEWFHLNQETKFDYIIGNPPYGANLNLANIPSEHVFSGESFSYFIEFCYFLLKQEGIFRFLLPEAILNVKRHTDIRKFILKFANLRRIKRYPKKFAGVMSDLYLIELDHGSTETILFQDGDSHAIPKSIFLKLKNLIFVNLTAEDISIIEKIEAVKASDLSSSIFGLGVVTGDNKTRLVDASSPGAELIYTGKEVGRYKLQEPRNFLVYDRAVLQQVAPDEIYRAKEKLVYKTISKTLKVAIDSSGSLTSNSANLIISTMPDLTQKSVMALLNSDLYTFLHFKLFGGVNKIAKENLMALPFPKLTKQQNDFLGNLIDSLDMDIDDKQIQEFINYEVFGLTPSEVEHISSVVSAI